MKRKAFFLVPILLLGCIAAGAATTTPAGPEAVMKEFLKAMQKEDKEKIKASFDWPALAEQSFPDFKKQPEAKQQQLITQLQIIFVGVFAMGKDANDMKVGKVATKGSEASAVLMKKDPKTGKMAPTSEFKLHKTKSGKWLIYSVARAESPEEKTEKKQGDSGS